MIQYTLLQTSPQTIVSNTNLLIDKAKSLAFTYVPKLIGAVILYLVGNWIIKKVVAVIDKILIAKKVDPSLHSFLKSFINVALRVLLIITILSQVGIPITGFAALLAGLGIALGSALNGSLGNIAGGIMLMIFRPFKVGDVIEAQGNTGKVVNMGIFSTIILTGDNKTVILPNGGLSTGLITNYNTYGNLKVNVEVTLDASNDIEIVKKLSLNTIKSIENVLADPAPSVNVKNINGGITFIVSVATTQANSGTVNYKINETLKKVYDANGVKFPISSMVISNAENEKSS